MPPLLLLLLPASLLCAQTTVAPAEEAVTQPRGQNIGSYNVVNSFETGYRFHTVGGEAGKYRSDVNFGNGLRLLSSRLGVYSKEGQGRLFDELVLTTQGLGNDPYEAVSLRVQRNKLYRYDIQWRLNKYYNPALTLPNGGHAMDTERRMQDHDLTLFPQSRVRIFLGYSRNTQDGPALSTVQLFDGQGDEFPLIADVRRQRNEYRLGGDAQFLGMRLSLSRGWGYFKEDTPYRQPQPSAGANPNDGTSLASLQRVGPYHGSSPYWRASLSTVAQTWFAASGRFTYTAGSRNFILDETAIGTDRFGAARNRQILLFGSGRRPVASGNLTLSLFPTSRLTLTNHTAFHNTRMDGDGNYRELNNATLASELLHFQFLGIRTISNTTEANYRVKKWLGLTTGYHYATRRIQSREGFEVSGTGGTAAAQQENHLHAGVAGVRLQPIRPLIITLDGEIGRADRPFTPVSENHYHASGARIQYKRKTLLLSAAARSNYNTISVSPALYNSRSRVYTADASWSPKEWFAFDAGYSKQHLNTLSGLAFFAASRLVDNDLSLYFSNIHAGNLAVRFTALKRVDFSAGYSVVQDVGDGRATAAGSSIGTSIAGFAAAQTFPLAYGSPYGRVSVRLHSKLRWNAGYQHYRYREEFYYLQNYRAHTGYASLLWSF
jgi:hypothetical protein